MDQLTSKLFLPNRKRNYFNPRNLLTEPVAGQTLDYMADLLSRSRSEVLIQSFECVLKRDLKSCTACKERGNAFQTDQTDQPENGFN